MLAQLAQAVRERRLSSVELVRESIERIGRLDPALNAVTAVWPEEALAEAGKLDQRGPEGPLAGLPLLVKDNTDVAGKVTSYASHSTWGPILEAGGKIYEFQPTMFHCKVLIVDDLLVSLGSTNFDERSFRINDEASLNVYDATFAREQSRIFAEDQERSREYTYADWQNRPWHQRVREWVSSTVQSQL